VTVGGSHSGHRADGTVVERVVVPARDAAACVVRAGQLLRVVDVEGQQIGDLVCFARDDPAEKLSTGETLNFNDWTTRISPGTTFRSNAQRPLLTVVEDTSGGSHDLFFAACTGAFYARYGEADDHVNCRDNLTRALQRFGIGYLDVPDPVNLFQHSRPRPDGSIDVGPPPTQPGDYICLRAETDVIVAVSSCPFDLDHVGPAVGSGSTPLHPEILTGEA
jgi:uncharacterized protein YcgI (DUF1989 family)